jgi:hypothetical protein
MGDRKGAYRVLVGKPEAKMPHGRSRRRWVDNIKMDLPEVEWREAWTDSGSGQGQTADCCKAVINFGVPYNARNFLLG